MSIFGSYYEMIMWKKVDIFLLILLLSNIAKAQNNPGLDYFSQGISVKFGYGYHAVQDEFISKEKYSGNSSWLSIDWSKINGATGFHLWLDVVNSANITNYSISAQLTTFEMSVAYLYQIGKVTLFDKPFNILAGPAPEFFCYYRAQNIARGGAAILDAFSLAGLLSLSLRLNFIYPIQNRLRLESSIQSNVISLAGKFIDPRDKDDSFLKVLTLLKALNVANDISVSYCLSHRLAFEGGYKFTLLRIKAWDDLLAASDIVYFGVMLRL